MKLYNDIIIPDFIESIVNSIKDTLSIDSYTDMGNGTFRANLSDTGRLHNYYHVTINNISYQITSVVEDTSFIFSSASEPATKQLTTKINYIHGDPVDIKNDLLKISSSEKEPIIALFEPIVENTNSNLDVTDYVSTDLWMAFCKPYAENWTTSEHYTYAIIPMRSLWRDFLLELKKKEGADIIGVGNYTLSSHSKYGLWNRRTGHTDSVLEKVSGIEITDFNINLSKNYSC